MSYEEILNHVGNFGKYQKLVVLLLCLIQFPTAFHFIAQVFLAANTDHWCAVPDSQAVNCSHIQLDTESACQEAQKNKSIPFKLDSDGRRIYSSCERYATDENISSELGPNSTNVVACDSSELGPNSTDVVACDSSELGPNSTDVVACDAGWDFDRSRYKSTINEEFGLVCDRDYLAGIAQSVWFAGLLTGSLVWGSVGDWIGRRKAFFLALCLVSVSSIVTTFASDFESYIALRFFTAACGYGASLIPIVLSSELVGPKKRVFATTLHGVFFAIGYAILSIIAFLIREWRHLQLALSLPYLLAFPLFFIFPESPRWLISKGRFQEAKKIIERMAKVNGTEVPENLFDDPDNVQEKTQQQFGSGRPVTQLDLLRTPNIRKKTLIIFVDWFVANMAYYGLSLSTSALGIDDYVAAFVSGAVEIPSYIFCWIAMERFGRRFTLAAFYGSGGLFCLITIFIPPGAARAVVAMVGKFASAAAFNHIYVYSLELYPTVIRSMGMGMSSMVARVSGILCPIILILGKYWEPLPLVVFGGGSLVAGVLSLLLPETKGYSMPDTLEEGEEFGKGQGFQLCPRREETPDKGNPAAYAALPMTDKSQTKPISV